MDKSKAFGIGGYRGRIIFLGDGSEVLTDGDDTEMFDREDKDLVSQVSKSTPSTEDAEGAKAGETGKADKPDSPATVKKEAAETSSESKGGESKAESKTESA